MVKLKEFNRGLDDALIAARDHFVEWYRTRALSWLNATTGEHAQRMGLEIAGVKVQDLRYCWGSCGKANRLYFHWKTILLSRQIAECVVVHEFVHLPTTFWRRLERAIPDYEQRKGWLARHGIETEGT